MYDVYATTKILMHYIIHSCLGSFHVNAMSKAFASCKSRVFKPSVNQL
jgi:hypothetical protein